MTLSLVNVTVIYPGDLVPVIENVNLQFEPGASVCLVGPSGSGKSTLLSVVGGLIRPNSGEVFYNNKNIWTSRAARRDLHDNIAWVFQSPNVIPYLPAIVNAALVGVIKGQEPDEAVARAAVELEQLGLSALSAKPTKLLSGGQSQRITVARALASGASLILADEPTGQLDPIGTSIVANALTRRIPSNGYTVIASHDEAVAKGCDKVYAVANRGVQQL